MDTAHRRSPGQDIASYFRAFCPGARWKRTPRWPPDAFALCNLVLDHTACYRFVVSPPAGRHWPPSADWNERVREAAWAWRSAFGHAGAEPPALARRCWEEITRSRNVPLDRLRTGEAWDLCLALLTLHAIADEACAGIASPDGSTAAGSLEATAWRLLARHGSLAHIPPARVRIVPKTNLASRGITIRSLSRYLALCYESIELKWGRVDARGGTALEGVDPTFVNVLLVPWPLTVRSHDFERVSSPLGNMDPAFYGFFQFAPHPRLDIDYVGSLLDVATADGSRVNVVILPESAVEATQLPCLEETLAARGVTYLISGVRDHPPAGFGRNYLHFGVRTDGGWQAYDQEKHHRWSLDESQIRQYHLSRILDPHKLWWEAITIGPRSLHVIDVGGGATTTPLVCEDLARMDEVADVLRRIGPSMVVAVLLDGPQLASRWPSRYASVLTDEPGSAVLTLTSSGMAARSRPDGAPPSHVVALWNDSAKGVREIELARGHHAVLITTEVGRKTLWTADGRQHPNAPDVVFRGQRQLRLPRERVSHEPRRQFRVPALA